MEFDGWEQYNKTRQIGANESFFDRIDFDAIDADIRAEVFDLIDELGGLEKKKKKKEDADK